MCSKIQFCVLPSNEKVMKNTFKAFLLLTLFLGIAFGTFGQIILNKNNYPIPYDTTNYLNITSQVSLPAVGNNLVWDYSNLNISGVTDSSYYITGNFPILSSAKFIYDKQPKAFTQFLGYSYDQYLTLDSSGIKEVGIHVPAINYGIGALTGNNADTLYILDNLIDEQTNPVTLMPLPYTVGTYVNTVTRYVVEMQLTLSANSMNKVPLQHVFNYHRTDSVIGWGTLKLPLVNGFITEFPVLQTRIVEYPIDSFYLNGTPAPDTLLAKFGLAQGQMIGAYRYRIHLYRENLFGYQMRFNFTDTTFSTLHNTGGAYIRKEFPIATGISSPNFNNEITAYPNPVTGGGFYISTNGTENIEEITLSDISGRIVYQTSLNLSDNIYVPLNENLPYGLYLLKVFDAQGNIAKHGKVIIGE